jgi:hypothetical protein
MQHRQYRWLHKPNQYARGVRRIGRGSARASDRQAVLIAGSDWCACAAERRKGSRCSLMSASECCATYAVKPDQLVSTPADDEIPILGVMELLIATARGRSPRLTVDAKFGCFRAQRTRSPRTLNEIRPVPTLPKAVRLAVHQTTRHIFRLLRARRLAS